MRESTGHISILPGIGIPIPALVLGLAMLVLLPGHARSQGSMVTPEEAVSVSTWEDSLIGPPVPTVEGELITTAIIPPEIAPPPRMAVHSDEYQQTPVIEIFGDYFDPSGLCSTGPMSEVSDQSIRSQMLKTYNMGFRCFLLRVDWPSLETQANRFDASRVQDLLEYASGLRMRVIISLELDRAPGWFFRGQTGSGRVTVSHLVDPELETSAGNDGDLRWSNGTGTPLMYHPDTLRAVNNLVVSLYNTIKDEQAFLGWYLCGPVTLSFPGGGRNSVVGMADYSPFTVSAFIDVTGAFLVAYPLPRYSRGTWDQRLEFRMFTDFRLAWKRDAFNQLITTLREADPEHLVFTGMDPVLNYRNDNGYLSMIQAPDATWQFLHDDVNGVVINFRLAADSFEPLSERSETSAMHLALTINEVIRNGRVALILIETDTVHPPSTIDILDIADMIKAAGGYPVWCSGFIQRRSSRWSWTENNAIEQTQPLAIMPPPKRIRRGQVGILDVPRLYSSFYAERNGNLVLSLTQLAIHQRTGVLLEVVGVDEIGRPGPGLSRYTNLIYLAPELIDTDEAKGMFSALTQLALRAYMENGGIIEAVDPMLLHQYSMEDYHSPVLEDQLRTRYVHRGAPADLFHGANVFVVANDPYVFIRINQSHGARYIDVKLAGWPEGNLNSMDVVELPSGDPHRLEITSGNASFQFGPERNSGHLYILTDDYEQVAKSYESRKFSVSIAQQSKQMRRSVPAALLLLALLAVTIAWMTFQSQQKSLIQAAELVDRSRRIEPIDILDEPEVFEFYKKYISENGEGIPEPADGLESPLTDSGDDNNKPLG